MKKTKNVYEWADKSINIQNGCRNNCKYCYAKKLGIRYNRTTEETWQYPKIKEKLPSIPHNKRIMFPSTHDIDQENIEKVISLLHNLILAKNQILIVSKPHLDCIKRICFEFDQAKDQIEFRFTIGSCDNEILKYWEPNAPTFEERLECVKFALSQGFIVSISCEPLLEDMQLYGPFDCFVSGVKVINQLLELPIKELWIGAMNYIKNKPKLSLDTIYHRYVNDSRIKWKNSFLDQYKKIL